MVQNGLRGEEPPTSRGAPVAEVIKPLEDSPELSQKLYELLIRTRTPEDGTVEPDFVVPWAATYISSEDCVRVKDTGEGLGLTLFAANKFAAVRLKEHKEEIFKIAEPLGKPISSFSVIVDGGYFTPPTKDVRATKEFIEIKPKPKIINPYLYSSEGIPITFENMGKGKPEKIPLMSLAHLVIGSTTTGGGSLRFGIQGPPGSGKTTTLKLIATTSNQGMVNPHSPHPLAWYVDFDGFTNYVSSCLIRRGGLNPEHLEERIKAARTLLIDGLDQFKFVKEDPTTLRKLLLAWNTVIDNKGCVVFSTKQGQNYELFDGALPSPQSLGEDLCSRVRNSSWLSIDPYGKQVTAEIIAKRLGYRASHGIYEGTKVEPSLEIVAEAAAEICARRSIVWPREIVGVVDDLFFHANLTSKPITPSLVGSVLVKAEVYSPSQQPRNYSTEEVAVAAVDYWNKGERPQVTLEGVTGPNRDKGSVGARQLAILALRDMKYPRSQREIGNYLGRRNPSTISAAETAVRSKVTIDPITNTLVLGFLASLGIPYRRS